jgi:hypothetical protein
MISKAKNEEVSSESSIDLSEESNIEDFDIEEELQFLENNAGYNPND